MIATQTVELPSMVALSTLPRIVCPSWCIVPEDEHVANLRHWEGFVIHWSEESAAGVRHSSVAYVDGPLSPHEPHMIFVEGAADGMPLEQAETLAAAILAAVREAWS